VKEFRAVLDCEKSMSVCSTRIYAQTAAETLKASALLAKALREYPASMIASCPQTEEELLIGALVQPCRSLISLSVLLR
jgi:hypothetical protein